MESQQQAWWSEQQAERLYIKHKQEAEIESTGNVVRHWNLKTQPKWWTPSRTQAPSRPLPPPGNQGSNMGASCVTSSFKPPCSPWQSDISLKPGVQTNLSSPKFCHVFWWPQQESTKTLSHVKCLFHLGQVRPPFLPMRTMILFCTFSPPRLLFWQSSMVQISTVQFS